MHDPANINLEAFLSKPRIKAYRDSTSPYDERVANRLYIWNHEVSSAFLGPLAIMEITLRNALNEQMISLTGTEDWIKYSNTAWNVKGNTCQLLPEDRQEFEQVINRMEQRNIKTGKTFSLESVEPSQIIAGTNLGAWIRLLGAGEPRDKKYNYNDNLWEAGIKNAFPNRGTRRRKEIHKDFNHLRSFRNRIAHHEPIHARNLKQVLNDIITTTRLVSKDAANLIKDHNTVQASLDAKAKALEGNGSIYI